MKPILKTILGLLIVQGAFGGNPKMKWTGDCQNTCDKCLEVEFQSGNKDNACLYKKHTDNKCLFEGNFEGKETEFGLVVVSSSQCLDNGNGAMDDIEVSFMDSRYPDAKMFKANTKIGSCSSEINKHLPNEAVMQVRHINQADRTWEYRMDDVQMRQAPAFPANGFNLNLAVRWDTSFANKFGDTAQNRAQNIMAHSQNHFQWDSLDAKMCFNIMSYKAYDGVLGGGDLDKLINPISTTETEDPNLFVYISNDVPTGGGTFTAGSGWVGVTCTPNNANINGGTNNGKGFRASISLWIDSDLQAAEVVSHEIGHNLGMEHDFTDANGAGSDRFCESNPSENCVNTGGVMDYFQPATTTWTCCSNSDFLKAYQADQPYCLEACGSSPTACEDKSSASYCSKNANKCDKKGIQDKCQKTCDKCPTMPPTQPPTTKPPTTKPPSCATSSFLGDGHCDDDLNNPDCNYDNGDCCPPSPPPDGWDSFCQVCECLEKPECEDESPASFCSKNANKCNKKSIQEKCMKTCDKCPTPAPPSGCGEPNFKGDGLCDDSNNNEACNYDDGDCCPSDPPPAGWDGFCTDCECKQPPPTEEPCKDEGSAKFCKKNKKKCKKAKISKQCKKTCNKCDEGPEPCEDTGSKKQCKKVNAKKCKKAKIAKKCKKSCNLC